MQEDRPFAHLMIDSHLDAIAKLVVDNWDVRISAETGSGKSIGVVGYLALQGYRVFVSVPTRLAARSLYEYLQKLCPNLLIGFAAEGQVEYDDDTQVVYATKGHIAHLVIDCYARSLTYNFCDILVLDETHTGTIDDSICASLFMKDFNAGRTVPKLVLMSATPTAMPIDPAPATYDIPVPRPFPVQIKYYPKVQKPYEAINNIVLECHLADDTNGNYLIFVSGTAEADTIVDRLTATIPNARVLPVYSALDSDQLQEIYVPTPSDKKRTIFVATNIAESSITLDDINNVFDLMDQKAIRDEILISCNTVKDSAIQRMGRTGRTCPGTCHRLCSLTEYERRFDHEEPEIRRVCIHEVVIRLIAAGIDPASTIFDIEDYKVARSVDILIELGMLIEPRNGVFETTSQKHLKTTNLGHFAGVVPLTIYNAAFLYNWIVEGLPIYPGVVIAAIINTCDRDYLYVPIKRKTANYHDQCRDYIDTKFGKWIGPTTLHTYIAMWLDMVYFAGNKHQKIISEPWNNKRYGWCRKNSVHTRSFTELILAVSRVFNTCLSFRFYNSKLNSLKLNSIKPDTRIFKFEHNYVDDAIYHLQRVYSRFELKYERYMSLPFIEGSFTMRTDKMFSFLEDNPPTYIIPLAYHAIQTSRGTLSIITMAIPGPSNYNSSDEE